MRRASAAVSTMSVGVRFKYARALEVLSTIEQENAELKKTCATIKELQEELEASTGDLKEARQEIEDLSTQLQQSRDQAADKAELHSLQQALDEERSGRARDAADQAAIAEANAQEVSNLKAELQRVREDLAAERQAANSQADDKLSTLERRLEEAEKARDQAERGKSEAEQACSKHKSEAKRLREDMTRQEDAHRSRIDQIVTDKEHEVTRRVKAEARVQELEAGRSDTDQKYQALRGKLEALRRQMDGVREELRGRETDLEREKEGSRQMESRFMSTVQAYEEERRELRQRVADLERELAASGGSKFKKFVQLKTENKNLEAQLQELRRGSNQQPQTGGLGPGKQPLGRKLKAASQRRRSSSGSQAKDPLQAPGVPSASAFTMDHAANPPPTGPTVDIASLLPETESDMYIDEATPRSERRGSFQLAAGRRRGPSRVVL